MTLPRGFGGGGYGRCTTCGEYKRFGDCETTDCKRNPQHEKKTLPISKFNIGQTLYFIIFFGSIGGIIIGTTSDNIGTQLIGVIFGIVGILMSNFFTWIIVSDMPRYKRESRMKSTFFWILPLTNKMNEYKFKDDSHTS